MKFRKLGSALLSVALLGSLLTAPSQAYVYVTVDNSNGEGISWDLVNNATANPEIVSGRVQLAIHQDGAANITDGSDLRAVNSCIKEINQVPDQDFRYKFASFTTARKTLADDVASVFWTPDGSNVITQDDGDVGNDVNIGGALGVTFLTWSVSEGTAGSILEMDIAMNSAFTWTTDPVNNPTSPDVKSVLLHEMLHGVGMGHSGVAEATLFRIVQSGTFSSGTLSHDDKAGLRSEYGTSGKYGSVEGTVTENGNPVLGAHVVLTDGKGSPVAAGLTYADGTFDIAGVRPGTYTLHVEPLDPEASPLFAMTPASSQPSYYQGADLTFFTTADQPGVTVTAGNITQFGTIAVTDGTPTLNITRTGLAGSFSSVPRRVRRGTTVNVGVAAPGLPSDAVISFTGTGITINSQTPSAVGPTTPPHPTLTANITIAADAPIGARNIIVTSQDGTERTIAAGALEILGPQRANADFDGDGATDFSLYRRNQGTEGNQFARWFLRWGLDLDQNNPLGGFDAKFIYGGADTDFPITGDWNGDGLTDVGVYRHATSTWYLLDNRTDGGPVSNKVVYNFGGGPSDIPLVGDWNGDGKDGIAIFRAETGEWYLNDALDNNPTVVVFGGFEDSPLVGDFNGDGISDLALFRFTTGQWFIDTDRNGTSEESFFYGGAIDDFPTVGDYDGDGDDDPGLWRTHDPNVGGSRWFMAVQRDGTGVTGDLKIVGNGLGGDQPLRGDFNGDGIDDPAVYNFSSGTFRVITSRSMDIQTGFLGNNVVLESVNFQYGGDPNDAVLTLP